MPVNITHIPPGGNGDGGYKSALIPVACKTDSSGMYEETKVQYGEICHAELQRGKDGSGRRGR